jgi:DNA-directed RNA polymerase subunit RPC12/RpoP
VFAIWLPTLDLRIIIILFPLAIAVLIAIFAIFYWASQYSQTQKIITQEGGYYKCPACGEKLYIMGNNDFKCSHCGTVVPYRSVAEK